MAWGTIYAGRLVLREGFVLSDATNANTGMRSLSITGEESTPPLTLLQVQQRREDLAGMLGRLVPIRFTDKADFNGWYQVTDVNMDVTNWNGEVVKFAWSIKADRVGPENAVDLESRLVGIGRANGYSLAGERWHAPAGGAFGYYTGTAQPSGSVARPSAAEGTITVYRGVPALISPRWGVSLPNYGNGRARVLTGSVERVATDLVVDPATWELNNALTRVRPGTTSTLLIAVWDGTAWDEIAWNVSTTATASGAITTWGSASVLRNDYEMVTLRLVGAGTLGRTTLDLTLRRGSRFVESYLQTDVAGIKSWYRATAEAGTGGTGYVSATANDGGGNRYVVFSSGAFTAATTQGGLSGSAIRTLDAGIGSVLAGGSAISGDQATQLRDQYIMTMAETTMGVRR